MDWKKPETPILSSDPPPQIFYETTLPWLPRLWVAFTDFGRGKPPVVAPMDKKFCLGREDRAPTGRFKPVLSVNQAGG
jgi:hypothetical protein